LPPLAISRQGARDGFREEIVAVVAGRIDPETLKQGVGGQPQAERVGPAEVADGAPHRIGVVDLGLGPISEAHRAYFRRIVLRRIAIVFLKICISAVE